MVRNNRTPVISLALAGATLALFAVAGSPEVLMLDRTSLVAQPWRLLTGHWVHLSWNHLLWDGASFAVLASALERVSRRRLLAVLGLSSAVISAAVVLAMPAVSAYAGLSGLAAALVTAVCVNLIRSGGQDRVIGGILGAAFIAKVVWEQVAGGVLFATGDDMAHATAVHWIGALVGILSMLPIPGRRTLATCGSEDRTQPT